MRNASVWGFDVVDLLRAGMRGKRAVADAGRRLRMRLPGYARRAARKAERPLRLHVGCGSNVFPGWVNVDLAPPADLLWDLRRGLPFPAGSADAVYSEHFIEHVSHDDGAAILREMHRVLRPGGVARVATPDLDYLVERYASPKWRDQDWLARPEYAFIRTRGRMLNVAMRWWGHQHLYNEEDLRDALEAAGFPRVTRAAWGKSRHKGLAGRETREDSKLILEAVK